MKRTLTALFCAASVTALIAQTNFRFTCSAPNREYTELSCGMSDSYILNQTARSNQYANDGIIMLFSPEHKKLGSFNYKIENKGAAYLTCPLLSKNKLLLLTCPLNPSFYGIAMGKHVISFRFMPKEQVSMQEYDPKTLKAVGAKRTLTHTVSKKSGLTLARSADGVYLAMLESDYPQLNKLKYTLFKNGEEQFTQDIVLEGFPKPVYLVMDESSLVLSNTGDLAFAFKEYNTTNPYTNVVLVSGTTKKVVNTKLLVKGQMTDASPFFQFKEDGSLIMAVTYGQIEKTVRNFTGVLVETFSSSLEKIKHVEIPFSSETIAKCVKSINEKDNKNVLYNQTIQNILTVKGGYVIVTEQETSVFINSSANSTATRTAYGNLVCIGVTDEIREQYQVVIRAVDQKMDFVLYEQQGSYASNNRVYIFYPGTDDKVKNTADEFDLFCATWEGGTDTPQVKTMEVQRPYNDLRLYPRSMRVLAPNKLLFYAQGNGGDVWTTVEITD